MQRQGGQGVQARQQHGYRPGPRQPGCDKASRESALGQAAAAPPRAHGARPGKQGQQGRRAAATRWDAASVRGWTTDELPVPQPRSVSGSGTGRALKIASTIQAIRPTPAVKSSAQIAQLTAQLRQRHGSGGARSAVPPAAGRGALALPVSTPTLSLGHANAEWRRGQ